VFTYCKSIVSIVSIVFLNYFIFILILRIELGVKCKITVDTVDTAAHHFVRKGSILSIIRNKRALEALF